MLHHIPSGVELLILAQMVVLPVAFIYLVYNLFQDIQKFQESQFQR